MRAKAIREAWGSRYHRLFEVDKDDDPLNLRDKEIIAEHFRILALGEEENPVYLDV